MCSIFTVLYLKCAGPYCAIMWQLFKFNGLRWDLTSAGAGSWIVSCFMAVSPAESGKFRGINFVAVSPREYISWIVKSVFVVCR